jgi:alkylation response protein AidB-like acyl-CoA dehydrogenase
MDLRPDPFQTQLRRALRVGLAGAAARPGVRGAPVLDGPASPASLVLSELSALLFEQPASHGGLELGLAAGATVSEELGRAACGNPYRAHALVADVAIAANRPDVLDDLRAGATAAVAGQESVTGPLAGVTAGPGGGQIELAGTATADAASADILAVTCHWTGSSAAPDAIGRPAKSGSAIALLPIGTAGYKWLGDGWPHAVQLAGVMIRADDLIAWDGAASGALAKARVRQAAYLLGLAAGMLEETVKYTSARRQFGSKLRDFQGVGFPLAGRLIALRATRMLVYRAAWLADTGSTGSPRPAGGDQGASSTAPLEALAAAAETLIGTARICLQACGGHGMTSELPVHRYYRLAAAEPYRYGKPADLWRQVGAVRLAEAVSAVTPLS